MQDPSVEEPSVPPPGPQVAPGSAEHEALVKEYVSTCKALERPSLDQPSLGKRRQSIANFPESVRYEGRLRSGADQNLAVLVEATFAGESTPRRTRWLAAADVPTLPALHSAIRSLLWDGREVVFAWSMYTAQKRKLMTGAMPFAFSEDRRKELGLPASPDATVAFYRALGRAPGSLFDTEEALREVRRGLALHLAEHERLDDLFPVELQVLRQLAEAVAAAQAQLNRHQPADEASNRSAHTKG